MKCKKCGAELAAGSLYCPSCGNEVQIVSDQSVLEDELLRFLIEDEGLQGKGDPAAEEDSSPKKETLKKRGADPAAEKKQAQARAAARKKKKRRRRIVLLVILAVCIIAALLIFRNYRRHTYAYLYRQAQISYNTGDYEEAQGYLEQAVTKDPDAAEAYLLLGKTCLNLEDEEGAEEAFLKTIELDPDAAEAYESLLALYKNAGDYDSITALYETVDSSRTEILSLFADYIVSVPEASEEEGTYNEALKIDLTSETEGEIYYTLDGSDPEKDGTLFEETIVLSEEGETTLLAVCISEDGFCSGVLEVTYELAFDIPDMPQASPDGGKFTSAATVSLTSESGTTIYYTWDGSTPTTSSNTYTGALDIPEGNNILSAVAVDNTTGKMSGVLRSNFIYYPE